jgi:hypothetical protein
MQEMQRRILDTAQQQASIQDILLKNKTRAGQTPRMVQNYFYVGTLTAVSPQDFPGSYKQLTISTDGDSDFIMCNLSGLVFNSETGAAIPSPFCRIQITDNSSQRAMFSDPALFSLVFGNAGFPYILQEPKLVTASTQIIVQYYNNINATPVNTDMQVSFGGYRVYY